MNWGYPNNSNHTRIKTVCESWDAVVEFVLLILRCKKLSTASYNEVVGKYLKDSANIGMSVFSKLMFFADFHIDKTPCMIIDDNVYTAIRTIKDKRLVALQKAVAHFQANHRDYVFYIKSISALANKVGMKGQQERLEYAFWVKGKEIKENN